MAEADVDEWVNELAMRERVLVQRLLAGDSIDDALQAVDAARAEEVAAAKATTTNTRLARRRGSRAAAVMSIPGDQAVDYVRRAFRQVADAASGWSPDSARQKMHASRIFLPAIHAGDWRELLGSPDLHWKKDYSAMEAARRWQAVPNDFPTEVAQVLATLTPHPLSKATLLAALPEYRIEISGEGFSSQADVLALADAGDGLALIAVEAKAEENFDEPIKAWLKGDTNGNKQLRFSRLCNTLELDQQTVLPLRYQLLHRIAGAVIEARRYHARYASMIVHSFSPTSAHHDEYELFAEALGVRSSVEPGQAAIVGERGGVILAIGWASASPSEPSPRGP